MYKLSAYVGIVIICLFQFIQAEQEAVVYKNNIDEIIEVWQAYLNSIDDWQSLTKDIAPKKTGCGFIYELKNPINRPHESFAIADMRAIHFCEPHYHPVETEIYFVLQGHGIVVVGSKEKLVQKGSVIITPPNTAHFTIAQGDLVLAVINMPPFKLENYVVLTQENKIVGFDKSQFNRLASQ